jgi:hypothetical protein
MAAVGAKANIAVMIAAGGRGGRQTGGLTTWRGVCSGSVEMAGRIQECAYGQGKKDQSARADPVVGQPPRARKGLVGRA